MKLKTLLLAVFALFILLASSTWTYKGQEFQDNQVVVYITGASLAQGEGEPTVAFEEVPQFKPGQDAGIQINGKPVKCSLTATTSDSQAIGPLKVGRLINGVQIAFDGPYTFVVPWKQGKLNYGTIELINAMEITGCAMMSKWSSRIQVGDLSWKDGGPRKREAREGGHVRGLDADVALMCRIGSEVKPCTSPSNFDPASSWTLVKTLAKYSDAQYIFLDQSLIDRLKVYALANEPGTFTNSVFFGSGRLVRHWPGHRDHFHIRIRCPKDDRQCIEQPGGYRRTEAAEQIEEEQENDVSGEPSASQPAASNLCKAGAMGDSITAWGSFNYVDYLNLVCPGGGVFDNHGIGGQGTGAMDTRFESDIVSHNYRDAIILAGVNDIASNRAVSTIKSNLANMYAKAKNAGMRVIAVTITPWQDHSSWTPEFQSKTEEVNNWILSKPANVDVVVDAYSVLNAFPTKPLHPSRPGQEAIGNSIFNAAYSSGQCEQLKCPVPTS